MYTAKKSSTIYQKNPLCCVTTILFLSLPSVMSTFIQKGPPFHQYYRAFHSITTKMILIRRNFYLRHYHCRLSVSKSFPSTIISYQKSPKSKRTIYSIQKELCTSPKKPRSISKVSPALYHNNMFVIFPHVWRRDSVLASDDMIIFNIRIVCLAFPPFQDSAVTFFFVCT